MSRNENARFATSPTIAIRRSKIDLSHRHLASANVGDVIPLAWEECLPGDTHIINTSKVVRMQPLVCPIMDNLYMDIYWFFTPNRLLWTHWKQFMGENTDSAWIPTTTYSVPQITAPTSTGWTEGTIADHLGIPTKVAGLSVNALPFRAYAKIMDDWFRSEVVTDPLYIADGDATVAGSNGTSYRTDVALGGKPFVAAKFHDMFTSCTPAPQKGPDVVIPLGSNAPVYTSAIVNNHSNTGLRFASTTGNALTDKSRLGLHNVGTNSYLTVFSGDTSSGTFNSEYLFPTNMYADLSNATGQTINALRIAFQIQKLLEKDAIGGTRYIEVIKNHFNITSPDARLQRAEYLGGSRFPINIHQVLSTAETTAAPIGDTGAYSLTVDSHKDCTYSCTEHGILMCLGVVRYDHSYQQALDRRWTRRDRYDYYWPVLSNIGNIGIRNDQIYAQGTAADSQIFGYQEAWCEYRNIPNSVSGQLRSNATGTLDAWHLADDYSTLPTLSDAWIREDPVNVDRALTVAHTVSDQYFMDIYFDWKAIRPMPLYSIPGLIDHN